MQLLWDGLKEGYNSSKNMTKNEIVENIKIIFNKSFDLIKDLYQKKPRILIILSCIFVLFILFFSGSNKKKKENRTPKARHIADKVDMVSIENQIDKRALWVDQMENSHKNLEQKLNDDLQKSLDEQKKLIEYLRNEIENQKQKTLEKQLEKDKKKAERDLNSLSKNPNIEKKIVKQMSHLHLDIQKKQTNKNLTNYVTSGSFVRATLLTGVVAETGVESASAPQPILLRLLDDSIFSKWERNQQIKEAILIGSCYGNLSSERAMCRLETLSLKNNDGNIIEKSVEGWVIGEDGRPGIKGEVIDKSFKVASLSAISGVLQSLSTSLTDVMKKKLNNNKKTEGIDIQFASAGSDGAGAGLNELAKYAIKRADQMSPVLLVGSGRVVDVVFKEGFSLETINETSQISNLKKHNNVQTVRTIGKQNDFSKTLSKKVDQGFNEAETTMNQFRGSI